MVCSTWRSASKRLLMTPLGANPTPTHQLPWLMPTDDPVLDVRHFLTPPGGCVVTHICGAYDSWIALIDSCYLGSWIWAVNPRTREHVPLPRFAHRTQPIKKIVMTSSPTATTTGGGIMVGHLHSNSVVYARPGDLVWTVPQLESLLSSDYMGTWLTHPDFLDVAHCRGTWYALTVNELALGIELAVLSLGGPCPDSWQMSGLCVPDIARSSKSYHLVASDDDERLILVLGRESGFGVYELDATGGGEGEKRKKPLLVIGPTTPTSSAAKSYSGEVVGRRVRVFWPLDKSWYEGCVRSFDEASGKHVVQYDDAEEETLDLGKERIEWVAEEEGSGGRLRRLRRKSGSCVMPVKDDKSSDEGVGEDDENDEDWGKGVEKETSDEDLGGIGLEEEEGLVISRRAKGKSLESKKRKSSGAEVYGVVKKAKVDGFGGAKSGAVKSVVLDKIDSNRGHASHGFDVSISGDAAERFGRREAEKFRFLGERRKDANGQRPGDVNYDPRTLYLPHDFLKDLTGGQRQWWEFKSKHMDKVLFFKMGKFYELFEMDAHVGARELDLQYMKGEQPHCGFPEKNFSMNLEKLAKKGYRVLVIEQTETPEQLDLRRKEMGSKDKVVKREICAVVTKGTLTEGELLSTNPDSAYLMSVMERCQTPENQNEGVVIIGVCMVDVSTNRCLLGQFEDNMERQCLCSILSELRPVEIIKPSNVLSSETEGALIKHTRNPLINNLIPSLEFWDAEKTIAEVEKIYGQSLAEMRDGLVAESDGVETAAALENLEILENNKNGGPSGTLFAQLDHCVTAFGKRLLRGWISRPLYHKESIIDRQDAIAYFKDAAAQTPALQFRKELSRLSDMERLLARIFASSEARRNANKAIFYEDVGRKQLQEFITALQGCQTMAQACSSLSNILHSTDSKLLHHMLTPGKGLPDVQPVLKHFKDAFDWSDAVELGHIVPHEGADAEYDAACKSLLEIESTLTRHLKEQHRVLGDASINYVTVGKESYLLEVPESLRESIPSDYELRSSKKGYFRYWTQEIKKLLTELSHAESEKESKLKSIMQRLIGHFSEYHPKWKQLVSTTAALDALISLAVASDYYDGPTCRPTITEISCSGEVLPCLSAKCLGHPILGSDSLGKGSFIPNDVSIGGAEYANFILLTGPNMGGKSTLLRQVCLAVILAQLGADVPAESFELSPVDRIFVRMGARDHIMTCQSILNRTHRDCIYAGKNLPLLSSATVNSLVALDELGRGTSTSDGQAIAESVLDYFVHKVQCRGMFSTHYHRLAVDYEKDPKVIFPGSDFNFCEAVSQDFHDYCDLTLSPSGIPQTVLQKAAAKSTEFEASYGKREFMSEGDLESHVKDDEIAVIKDLLHFPMASSCQSATHSTSPSLLLELQQRARLVLQGS
ncbi:DNA mismatch repair protein MSH6 [Acorus calamus]|uniref:DNA mismatch repair protein MSH6 n=1 Tax=Acorus calamus TaxID=4465 RepID=A0AAV9D1Q1_ACOCL|nr:DNA mismatch repair protein MSH6 [Acorus calamus]